MKQDERRKGIIKILEEADSPVSAGRLAEAFNVSRQIIVKDIAALREAGECITARSRGYILENRNPKRVFKVIHSDEEVEKELTLIVDMGGIVEDVFVCHKFYNRVSARMEIKTRSDVKAFLSDIAKGKSSLLKNITSDYHYHTVSAESEEILDFIGEKLKSEGFLAPLTKFEPEELKGKVM